MNNITFLNNQDRHGNIKAYDAEDLEIYIHQQTGESFTSVSGLARMCNVHRSTISKYISGCDQNQIKKAEVSTAGGLQGVALINEDLILEALGKYNTILLVKIAKLGLRVFLHAQAGFEITTSRTLETSEDIDPEKVKIFQDLIKACKGQEVSVKELRTHSLLRRKNVRTLYASINQQYLRKAELLKLFINASKHGYGIFDSVRNIFKPSRN